MKQPVPDHAVDAYRTAVQVILSQRYNIEIERLREIKFRREQAIAAAYIENQSRQKIMQVPELDCRYVTPIRQTASFGSGAVMVPARKALTTEPFFGAGDGAAILASENTPFPESSLTDR